jgi:hypothetical protein
MSMLGVTILAESFDILAKMILFGSYLGKTAAEIAAEHEELTFPEVIMCCSWLFWGSVIIGTVVTYCLWVHQAHANLRLLAAGGLHYSPAWAVAWYFIPGANLVLPLLVMFEIYKASDPEVPAGKPFGWKESRVSLLIPLWWGFWLAASFIERIGYALSLGDHPPRGRLLAGEAVGILGALLMIAAAGLLILLIRQIHLRQKKKFDMLAVQGHPMVG